MALASRWFPTAEDRTLTRSVVGCWSGPFPAAISGLRVKKVNRVDEAMQCGLPVMLALLPGWSRYLHHAPFTLPAAEESPSRIFSQSPSRGECPVAAVSTRQLPRKTVQSPLA